MTLTAWSHLSGIPYCGIAEDFYPNTFRVLCAYLWHRRKHVYQTQRIVQIPYRIRKAGVALPDQMVQRVDWLCHGLFSPDIRDVALACCLADLRAFRTAAMSTPGEMMLSVEKAARHRVSGMAIIATSATSANSEIRHATYSLDKF